jgi:ABC-type enterobactin transport system permease subunit
MSRLFMLLFSIAFTTLAGIGIVVVLVLGRYDAASIIAAAVAGGIVALPATWLVARRMQGDS